jgi:hypothetical protein
MSEQTKPNKADPSTPLRSESSTFLPSTIKETLETIIPHLNGQALHYKPYDAVAKNTMEEIGRVNEEKRVHFIMEKGILASWTKTVVQVKLLQLGSTEAMDKLPVKDEKVRESLLELIFDKYDTLKGEMNTCANSKTIMKYSATGSGNSATNTYHFEPGGASELNCASSEHPETLKCAEEISYNGMNCETRKKLSKVFILAALCGAINMDEELEITANKPSAQHFKE